MTTDHSTSRATDPIAIVGMACRYPGASSIDALWKLLRAGHDATTETPPDRCQAGLHPPTAAPGRSTRRRGGYIKDPGLFDAGFFGVTSVDADQMDPQQRMLLMTAWEAFEDAGIPPDQLAGTRTGIYVGSTHLDYHDLITRTGSVPVRASHIYNQRGVLSGRLAQFFDLRGPAITLDTSSSSSLVAVHLACQSLRTGETTMAVAAGANLTLTPDSATLYALNGMLAPDGRSKFGDARADGFAPSDGIGVVILKPLTQAIADGDRIRAVILGGAVANGGRQLAVPSVDSYVETLRWAYRSASVNPADIDFAEAGTGDPAHDLAEFTALGQVLARDRPPGQPCYVGSVATNVGHAEAAAGMAALIKTVLCLEHRTIVPSLHHQTPNPKIAWEELPLTVPTVITGLPDRGRRLLAGVSGHGLSATNAHLVLSSADNQRRTPAAAGPYLFVTSARTDHALHAVAAAYLDYLRPGGPGGGHYLADICRSAARHRQHHQHRFAAVVTGRRDLTDRLHAHLDGRTFTPVGTTALRTMARAYLSGVEVDWTQVHPEPGYVPIPTYPWQTKRYWIQGRA